MDLEKRKYYNNKYENLAELLGSFLFATYDLNETDEETIRKHVLLYDSESIKDTLKEGKEVLALKPFPHEWVYAVTGYLSLDRIKADTKEEKFKKWVSWMMEALEKEGKKQGKL